MDGGGNISPRSLFLGFEENAFEAPNQTHQRDAGAGVPPLDGESTAGEPSHLGKNGGGPRAHLEGGTLVAQADAVAGGKHQPGKAPRSRVVPVESREWALAQVERVVGTTADPLWSKATRRTYAGYIERWLRWVHAEGRTEGPLEDSIEPYIQWLALGASGDTVLRTAKALLRAKGGSMSEEEKKGLLEKAKLASREANGRHIISPKAADALPLEKLREFTIGAKRLPYIPPAEAIALDALVVAFSTLSRTGEILALTTADVAEDGSEISIRAKMDARTGRRHLKAVKDAAGLAPASILRARRKAALSREPSWLFPSTWHKGEAMATSEATKALGSLAKRVGLDCRVTAHGGRKGGAVEAVMAGMPVVAVQAYGLWKQQDSLLDYVGPSIRRQLPFLSTLETAALGVHGKEAAKEAAGCLENQTPPFHKISL